MSASSEKIYGDKQAMMWLLTALSLIGVWLNIKKNRVCFYIWTFTNASWMIIDFYHKIYAQAGLFAIYVILAGYGIYAWGKSER